MNDQQKGKTAEKEAWKVLESTTSHNVVLTRPTVRALLAALRDAEAKLAKVREYCDRNPGQDFPQADILAILDGVTP